MNSKTSLLIPSGPSSNLGAPTNKNNHFRTPRIEKSPIYSSVYSLHVSHAALASRWCVVRSGPRRHASKKELAILRVGLFLPPRFCNLSFAPLAVFETANLILKDHFYDLHVVSVSGGLVINSFGVATQTERADQLALDTLLIGAPSDIREPSADVVDLLQRSYQKTRRIASICVGAFILGSAGLLDGRRSTTHWFYGRELQSRFPKTRVEIDRIFVGDGSIWTSAGMTAGVDLALTLVERDIGP